jgi:hypothetical protein
VGRFKKLFVYNNDNNNNDNNKANSNDANIANRSETILERIISTPSIVTDYPNSDDSMKPAPKAVNEGAAVNSHSPSVVSVPIDWPIDMIVDATFSAQISLLATAQEFIGRKREWMRRARGDETEQQQQRQRQSKISEVENVVGVVDEIERPVPVLPLLTSHCPGIVSYAQQSHRYLLPHLSPIKSQQQVRKMNCCFIYLVCWLVCWFVGWFVCFC